MFNETRLLDRVAYGSEFGRGFRTRIVNLRSGVERRNADWAAPIGRYRVLYQRLDANDHALVAQAHMASMGSLIPFRFKDWSDFEASQELIGTGTGSLQTLQLTKTYNFGPISLARIIKKPVAETVVVYADGLPIVAAVNTVTGEVIIDAAAGAVITWSGEFDVPVRFGSDRLDVDAVSRGQNGLILTSDVGLVEVRE